MKRSASLDFLRGSAAFAVAIPHYLTANVPFRPFAEAVAVSGVEVFFVLSGFVLAPQIVRQVVGGPWRNLGVFLARRWMRTIPPYAVALLAVALITGNLLTGDFGRYFLYVENLTHEVNAQDFYPVAWSLAVEEWFYLLFAPLLFLVGWLFHRSDRRLEVGFAVLFIIVVAALRHFATPADWDLNVRRVTIFRIDSIVWGYLLFLTVETRPEFSAGPGTAAGPRVPGLAALAGIAVAATALELWIAFAALTGTHAAQQAFPYSSALFGMAWVVAFRFAEPIFAGRAVRALSFWLGRISYSAYLFHIIAVMLLKPRIDGWPIAAQLAVYLAIVCSFSTLFWRGFERPILAARPTYAGREPRASLSVPKSLPPGGARSLLATLALGLALIGALAIVRDAFMANMPWLFYPALVAAGGLALPLAEQGGRFAGGAGAAARTLLVFALVLPVADALYRASTGVPLKGSIATPTYSYRAASENPTAFAMWWFYYLNEWIRDDGVRGAIEAKDPTGELPFILKPGASGRMFDATVHIDREGFRGPEIAPDKGDRFRIFVLGESQTFGPTLHEGEKPWPEILQGLFDQASCSRPVEVVNAGTEAYTLDNNLVRARRDILPLRPDLILSAHGMNGFAPFGLRRLAEPNEPGVRPRASALIGETVFSIERAAHRWRTRNIVAPQEPPPFTDQALLASRYADEYRKLITLGREQGVPIVLATSSMAVDESSPRLVRDFYGTVFKPIDDIVAANLAHNRLVRLLSQEEGVPVIDAGQGVDGNWDDDLYLDIVHFTERGNQRTAQNMFTALLPLLDAKGVSCAPAG
jgi:peptidoglycan/LPS O-acetylase OafA/YrhL